MYIHIDTNTNIMYSWIYVFIYIYTYKYNLMYIWTGSRVGRDTVPDTVTTLKNGGRRHAIDLECRHHVAAGLIFSLKSQVTTQFVVHISCKADFWEILIGEGPAPGFA